MTLEPLLQASALVLSVVNGLALLRNHLRDRPKLAARPIYPDAHQWWARLMDGERGGQPVRRYGFLAYISVVNRGLRPVSLAAWELEVPMGEGSRATLTPLSIPEPEANLGAVKKVFPVLGQKGVTHDGDLRVDSGGEVSGMAFFVVECFGPDHFNPLVRNGAVTGTFRVDPVFGSRASCSVSFREHTVGEFSELLPGLPEMIRQVEQSRSEPSNKGMKLTKRG